MSAKACAAELPVGLFGVGEVPVARSRMARVLGVVQPQVVLPVVVDRVGALREVSVWEAGDVVRTVLARSGGSLVVDVETTGFPVGHRDYELRTVQLGDAQAVVVFDVRDRAQAEVVRELLAGASGLVAHVAVADLVPLARAGLVEWDAAWVRVLDTVVVAKLADPVRTGSDPGLKQLARVVLGAAAVSPGADRARAELFTSGGWVTAADAATPVCRSGWAQVDPGWVPMVRYAAGDVLDTAALAQALPAPDPGLLARERTVARLTARLSYEGLRLDGEHVRVLLAEHTVARARAATRVRGLGVGNPGSSRQVAAALVAAGAELPLTGTGLPSVAGAVLEPLRGVSGRVGELAGAVLAYRGHDTLIGTFLRPYELLCTAGDGRVRPTVYTLGAETGRMSCVRPNLQQLPRQGGIRACVTADPGQVLISADFTGVELRVAAALSGDVRLRGLIAHGVDLHGLIARQVFGPGASKADRYAVKRGVFGRLYGGGIPTLARQVGCAESVAAAMVATLDELTPELTRWAARLRAQVKAGRTQYRTYSGAVVHLPRGYPHKAPNYVIQRSARELLVDALLRWADTAWGDCVLLPVHDELLVMVPEPDAPTATRALVECMTTELGGVAILAQPSEPSYAWADAA